MISNLCLVVQEDGDGGDCPNRTGTVLGAYAYMNFKSVSLLLRATQVSLRDDQGRYIRYPTTWNDPKDFSRDQASRLMLGYFMAGALGHADNYYRSMNYRCAHPNGDLIGVGEIVNIFRSHSLLAYPFLLILDVKYLWDVLVSWRLNNWDADNLFVMDLFWAQKRMPTPFAWLAKKLYNKKLAKKRVAFNLNAPGAAPGLRCLEAYLANIYFLDNM